MPVQEQGLGILNPLELVARGLGYRRVIPLTVPAAGADVAAIGPPGGTLWLFVSWRGILTAAAAAANRAPTLTLLDADRIRETFGAAAVLAANNVGTMTWASGFGATTNAGGVQTLPGPSPLDLLFPGDTLQVVTANIQAADQWAVPVLTVLQVEVGRVSIPTDQAIREG